MFSNVKKVLNFQNKKNVCNTAYNIYIMSKWKLQIEKLKIQPSELGWSSWKSFLSFADKQDVSSGLFSNLLIC